MVRRITFTNQEAEALYQELKNDGYGTFISKKEYARIANCSQGTVNNYIAKGYGIPNYQKVGANSQSRIMFRLKDVAEYLTQITVRTA